MNEKVNTRERGALSRKIGDYYGLCYVSFPQEADMMWRKLWQNFKIESRQFKEPSSESLPSSVMIMTFDRPSSQVVRVAIENGGKLYRSELNDD